MVRLLIRIAEWLVGVGILSLPLFPGLCLRIYKKNRNPPLGRRFSSSVLFLKMASISRVEINVVNNTKLRANAQSILALTRAERPKNISLNYKPKQKEFKVSR